MEQLTITRFLPVDERPLNRETGTDLVYIRLGTWWGLSFIPDNQVYIVVRLAAIQVANIRRETTYGKVAEDTLAADVSSEQQY